MPVARLMGLQDGPDDLQVIVRWKGLDESEDPLEPLTNVFEDVPVMVKRVLQRKRMPKILVAKANAALSI